MNSFVENNVSLEKCPALVLNADYRPLSYYPLSLWCWQDAVKSVFLNRVSIVSNYKRNKQKHYKVDYGKRNYFSIHN